jgi:hypothetical protein
VLNGGRPNSVILPAYSSVQARTLSRATARVPDIMNSVGAPVTDNVRQTLQQLIQDVIAPDVGELKIRVSLLEKQVDVRFGRSIAGSMH